MAIILLVMGAVIGFGNVWPDSFAFEIPDISFAEGPRERVDFYPVCANYVLFMRTSCAQSFPAGS